MTKVHPAELLFTDQHPLTADLKMTFHASEDNSLKVTLAAPKSFAENANDTVHTGFNTLLLDTVLGSCAIGELKEPKPIATVKLNVNHMDKAKVGEAIACNATYEAEENEIAYVSGEIRSEEDGRIIAQAIGTFMIGTATKSIREKS